MKIEMTWIMANDRTPNKDELYEPNIICDFNGHIHIGWWETTGQLGVYGWKVEGCNDIYYREDVVCWMKMPHTPNVEPIHHKNCSMCRHYFEQDDYDLVHKACTLTKSFNPQINETSGCEFCPKD